MGRSIRWASMAVAGLLLTGSAIPAAAGEPVTPADHVWTVQKGTTLNDGGEGVGMDGTDIYAAASVEGSIGWLLPVGGADVVVMRTSEYGAIAFQNRFGTPDGADFVYDLAVGKSGAAYVVGQSTGAWNGQFQHGGTDAWVAKVRPAGTVEWVRSIGTSGTDRAWAVATDGEERVIVTGTTTGAFPGKSNIGGEDLWVRILDKDGGALTTLQLGSTADDWPNSVVAASGGTFWVTGWTEGTFPNTPGNKGGKDAILLRFTPGGVLTWVRRIASGGDDVARAVALAGKGKVVVGLETDGTIGGGSGVDDDIVLRSFSSTGGVLWTRRYGSPQSDSIFAIQKAPGVGFMTAGSTSGTLDGQTPAGLEDAYIRFVGPSGLWTSTTLVGTSATDRAFDAVIGPSGSVVITGQTSGAFPGKSNSGLTDFFLARR